MTEAEDCDVAVVGGGPAGLACAHALRQAGIARVVLLEREGEAGGIPRHCGHSPFGMREFHRVMGGRAYAAALSRRAEAAGVEIRTGTHVTAILPGPALLLADRAGTGRLDARRVVLATGARERPRAARLVSGERPAGVLNTGALQAMVHLKGRAPFRRPVIVGTELVAFSALLTCRSAGIRPAAMIEAGSRPTAWAFAPLLPRLMGVPLLFGSRVAGIEGRPRVERVIVESQGERRAVACDGVLFTGSFTPEASLARCGHLDVDPGTGGPAVDQYGRCSDPAFYAAGNLLRPVETAGWSWREGGRVAGFVAADLAGGLGAAESRIAVRVDAPLRFAVPQRLSLPGGVAGAVHLQLRTSAVLRGALALKAGDRVLWTGRIHGLPERRLLVPMPDLAAIGPADEVRITFTQD